LKGTEVAMAAAAVGMVRCLEAGDGDREGPGEAIGMRSATREIREMRQMLEGAAQTKGG
jgi:hypothetical protein